MKVFEKEPLERLTFVIQTGGRNPKVKQTLVATEGIAYAMILFKQSGVRLTEKGICHIFGEEDKTYRGYIKYVNGVPEKFKPAPEDIGTKFNDWYTEA